MDIGYFVPYIIGGSVLVGYFSFARRKITSAVHFVGDWGVKQKYMRKAASTKTLKKLLTLGEGCHFKISGSDFTKWTRDKDWINYVNHALQDGVKITAFGNSISKKAKPEINKLCNKGLEVILSKQCSPEHTATVTPSGEIPKQIWYEQYHAGNYASNCVYTDMPHEHTWKQTETYFKNLEKSGSPYIPQERVA